MAQQTPAEAAAALERLKFMMGMIPSNVIPVTPAPMLPPRVITFPTHANATMSAPRFLLITDAGVLSIVDTLDGVALLHSIEGFRERIEGLLRLANRPE